jgi:hypothetical protein
MLARRVFLMVLSHAALLIPSPAFGEEPIRFDVDVMAVLSRGGCNQGACHGNLNGKGGFKLSLRGEDPAWDYSILTHGTLGRRTDRFRPENSLILRKATATVPHEGGRRFEVGSEEYQILLGWITAGTPQPPAGAPKLVELTVDPAQRILFEPDEQVRLRVTAQFSDGRARDVTRLGAYEAANLSVAAIDPSGLVNKIQNGETTIAVRFLGRHATVRLAFVPARPGFDWVEAPEANFIDRQVFAKLRSLRCQPSVLSDDATFLRRVYLDTIGALPTVAEARKFVADQRIDKRSIVIDELLGRPEFADHWALKWCDLLRNEEKVLDRKGVQAFHDWIRRSIAEGKPLNEFARELIAARGSTYSEPAANYYRALRDPLSRAEATAQVFLGLRLQCARCHNHPFDRWTQDDYFQLAAFFPRVRYRIIENNRRDKFDQHEFEGEQIVWIDRGGEVMHPRTNEPVPPRFLGAEEAPPGDADRLVALADWVARPDNPFFARAQVNRVWGNLLGRALVEPNDDFRATNPPSHPELLDDLARDFVEQHFDLRHLIRTILNSRTYQLSWRPNETNRHDDLNDSHAAVRRLEAEVLLDALAQVTGVPVKFAGQPLGTRAMQLPGVQPRQRGNKLGHAERFLRAFGKPDRLLNCDCERNEESAVPQSLVLLTGEPLLSMLRDPDNRLHKLLAAGKSDAEILEEFYLAALSRLPAEGEKKAAAEYLARSKDRQAALEDIIWALLNTKEFLVRR